MTQPNTDTDTTFEALAPSGINVEISTGRLTITPIRVKELPAFARAIEPFMQQIVAVRSEELDVAELLIGNMDDGLAAISVGARISRQTLDEMTLDDLVEITAAVIEVNLDFFTRRVMPRVTRLTEHLAQHMAGPTSSTASSGQAGE